MSVDETVQTLIRNSLDTEASWLLAGLDRVLRITASRPESPYSFEWLVHTALAAHLLKQTAISVSSIRIGLKETLSAKKPDIAFQVANSSIAIQIKTVPSFAANAYQEGDVVKTLEANYVYLLVVSYPCTTTPETTSDCLCTVTGPCGFLWRVRKIKEAPNNTPEGICQPADGLSKPSA